MNIRNLTSEFSAKFLNSKIAVADPSVGSSACAYFAGN